MKNALILHGTNGSPKGNWFGWLKIELEKRGWRVWVPDLPQNNRPNIERYNDFILKNNKWTFNRESILVGHSSGAVAILGLLETLPEGTKVRTCYLVGSFKDNLKTDDLSGLFLKPFDFEKIKTKADEFVFIHSDNDPYCPLSHAEYLAQKTGGKLIVKKGQKHFSVGTAGEKYKKFPFLLNLIKKHD